MWNQRKNEVTQVLRLLVIYAALFKLHLVRVPLHWNFNILSSIAVTSWEFWLIPKRSSTQVVCPSLLLYDYAQVALKCQSSKGVKCVNGGAFSSKIIY